MRILITGGCGFIGTNISLLARKKGYEVVAFDSLIRKGSEENVAILQKAGVKVFHGDVRVEQDFVRLHKENQWGFDGIIHLAGNPGIPWSIDFPKYDFEVNAMGTINVLEFSRAHSKPPVIYASTNKTYSDLINTVPLKENATRYEWHQPRGGWMEGIDENGISESFPTDGFERYSHSPYGVSKLTGDHYCQEYFHTFGIPTVINRMSCIYGYYQKGVADQGWIDHFVRQVIAYDKPMLDIYGDGKQVRDMLWGEDVAELYLKELEDIETTKGKIFNVGGGVKNTLSLMESIQYLEKISGKKIYCNFHDWRTADQKIYISNTAKAKEELGWEPTVTPQEGIQKMYDKYKSERIA